jgi:hypothetical protein
MAGPEDVMAQLFPPRQGNGQPPGDTITLYEGASQAKNGFSPWKAWDVRSWLNRLSWDLLRFKKIDDGVPSSDRSVPYGLRDTITAIWFLVDQNNKLLHQLLTEQGSDVTHFAAVRDETEPTLDVPFTEDVAAQHAALTEALQQVEVAPAGRLDTETLVAIQGAVSAAVTAALAGSTPSS